MMTETTNEHKRMRRLHKALVEKFNSEELRVLCFDLNVPYKNLGGEGHSAKALEVVEWCQRHTRLDELEAALALPGTPPQDSAAWRAAMELYRERIEETCGWMQILGQPKPIPLDDIFTEVYLLDKPTAWRRYSLEQLQEEFASGLTSKRQAARQDGLALVTRINKKKQNQRLFILGKPGAGKTTFLKQIALQAALHGLESEPKIPIFISLKSLADSGNSVLDFIIDEFAACYLPATRGAVVGLLRNGQARVLLDGLDEVPESNERQTYLLGALRSFVRDHPKNQYIITCRIAAADYTFESFTYVEMADFTPTQVTTFVGKWFREDAVTRDMFLSELYKLEHRPLQELATVPLLLALLCLAFEETLSFPQQRIELYEEALDALLKKWDSSRRIRRDEAYYKLSLGRKRELFAELAWPSFEQERYFIPKADLIEHLVEYLRWLPPVQEQADIDGEAILNAIEAQHGILMERARGIYAFAHLTFQEYYAARYVTNHLSDAMVDELLGHAHIPRWREVFLLVTSLLPHMRATWFFEAWLASLVKVSQQPGLATWLRWVSVEEVEQQHSNLSALVHRSYRFYHGLSLAPILIHTRTLTRTIELGRDLSHNLEHKHILDIDGIFENLRKLDLSLNRVRDLDRMLVTDGHTFNDTDIRTRALDHARARELARSRIRERKHELERAFELSMMLDRHFGRVPKSNPGLDIAFIAAMLASEGIILSQEPLEQSAFQAIYYNARRSSQTYDPVIPTPIYHKLLALKSFHISAFDNWQTQAHTLRDFAESHFALPPAILLTKEAISALETYLASTHCLLECLEVAFVSNKETIIDSLLRPPGWTRA